jgi:hypothetical protein
VIFADEAHFDIDCIINIHYHHHWAEKNPHGAIHCVHQQQFSINVWAGIVNDFSVGPHVLPHRFTDNNYRDVPMHDLPELVDSLTLAVRARMWYTRDGTPAYFSRAVKNVLSNIYDDRWIGRGVTTAWPPRSPDLNPLNFYTLGHLKTLVYAAPVDNEEALPQLPWHP